MTWEHRWREMIVAGGALAATACADVEGNPTDAGMYFEGCCNANPDGCCGLLYCERPDALAYASCEQQQTACQAEGGTYGFPGCSFMESGPSDAASEATSFPSSAGCCNANPDPCCYMTCGDAGPDSSAYDLCEQDRATCQSHDGYYETLDDGALGCSFFPEAGPSDAGDGGDGHD
jgi:hypothetical protein